MDAIKFINEKVRMCNSRMKSHTCTGCPLAAFDGCDFDDLVDQYRVEEAVEFVEKWLRENPRKTRQSEFLKQYPDTLLDSYGVIEFCPMSISASHRTNHGDCNNAQRSCRDCRKDFWLKEVE